MAILVKNLTRSAVTPKTNAEAIGFTRDTTITIENNGEVLVKPIDLGYQGDNHATTLVFDISKLKENNADSSGYTDAVIFYNPKYVPDPNDPMNHSITIACQDHNLSVPLEITQVPGTWSMIYIIYEPDQEGGLDGNVEDYVGGDSSKPLGQEIFVSQTFTGTVKPSLYQYLKDFDSSKVNAAIQSTGVNRISKKAILTSWDAKNMSVNSDLLGYKYDAWITQVDFTSLLNIGKISQYKDSSEVFMAFKGDIKEGDGSTSTKIIVYNTEDDFCAWVPSVITQNPGKWEMCAFVQNNLNSVVSYTNSVNMIVRENFLTANDLQIDDEYALVSVPIYSVDALLQANDGDIYVLATSDLSERTLPYNFDTISSAIGWVRDNKTIVDEHLENTNIHITAEERVNWNSKADGSLTQTVNVLVQDNKDQEGRLAALETWKGSFENTDVGSLRADLDKEIIDRTAADKSLQNQITSHTVSINNLDAVVKSNTNAITTNSNNIKTNTDNITDLQSTVGKHETQIYTLEGVVGNDQRGLVKTTNDHKVRLDNLDKQADSFSKTLVAETEARTLADEQEQQARISADEQEKQARINADEQEKQERVNADNDFANLIGAAELAPGSQNILTQISNLRDEDSNVNQRITDLANNTEDRFIALQNTYIQFQSVTFDEYNNLLESDTLNDKVLYIITSEE